MSDYHGIVPEPTEEQLTLIRDSMLAFIFPNEPKAEDEQKAFEKAVGYQYEHDETIRMQMNDSGIPDGVESFRIGDFSMNFEEGTHSSRLNMKNICPAAYGVLLRAGLLYRGVEGRL